MKSVRSGSLPQTGRFQRRSEAGMSNISLEPTRAAFYFTA
jgi:hypothetical protein